MDSLAFLLEEVWGTMTLTLTLTLTLWTKGVILVHDSWLRIHDNIGSWLISLVYSKQLTFRDEGFSDQ